MINLKNDPIDLRQRSQRDDSEGIYIGAAPAGSAAALELEVIKRESPTGQR